MVRGGRSRSPSPQGVQNLSINAYHAGKIKFRITKFLIMYIAIYFYSLLLTEYDLVWV